MNRDEIPAIDLFGITCVLFLVLLVVIHIIGRWIF